MKKFVDATKRVLGNEHLDTVSSVEQLESLCREISDGTPIATGLC